MKPIKPKNPIKLTELDHLTICHHRGLLTTLKDQKYFYRHQSGKVGEYTLLEILLKHLPTNWKVLQNVWLEIDGNRTEVDILVVAPKFWWAIEAKNYKGKFEYRDQICYLNQNHFPDKIAPCRNRQRILKLIAANMAFDIPEVFGSMVFIDERCQVESDFLEDIKLVMRYQLTWHIDEMLQRHRELTNAIPLNESLTTLEKFEIDNPFQARILDISSLEKTTKGFRCMACNRYNMVIHQYTVACRDCRHTVNKTEAVLHAAAELGTLFYTDPKVVTTHNVYEFTAGKISKKGIRSILKANLRKYGDKRYTYYENNSVPYQKLQ